MNKTLIKFKHIDDTSDYEFIEATYTDTPAETLKLIKEVCSIKLKDNWYKFCSSEFQPAKHIAMIDALYIYVEGYDDEEIEF